MKFVNANHKNHHDLWMERAKYVTDFIITGANINDLREHLGIVEHIGTTDNALLIYCIHLDIADILKKPSKRMVCYSCLEDELKRWSSLLEHKKCKFCPIKWRGFKYDKDELKCLSLNSPYYKIRHTNNLTEFADLCKQIANMKWRDK